MDKEEKLIYFNRAIFLLKNEICNGICAALISSIYLDLYEFHSKNSCSINGFISNNFIEIFKYKPHELNGICSGIIDSCKCEKWKIDELLKNNFNELIEFKPTNKQFGEFWFDSKKERIGIINKIIKKLQKEETTIYKIKYAIKGTFNNIRFR